VDAVTLTAPSLLRYSFDMSKATRRAVKALAEKIDRNLPIIRRKLAKAGVNAPEPLLYSAAKYYEALNRLAKG
jgi:hypothetical protein